MATDIAKNRGCKRRTVWLDGRTAKTMKDIAGAAICICMASEAPLCWNRLTERRLEQRFGRIRTSFGNAQLSAGDYFRASLRLMKQDLKKTVPAQTFKPKPICEDDFMAISRRAYQSARKLAAMCSGLTESELSSMANMYWAQGHTEEDDEEEDDAAGGQCLGVMGS